MTADEFRATLAALNLRQSQLAKALGVQRNTVYRWAHGGLAVPKYAECCLELMRELADIRRMHDRAIELYRSATRPPLPAAISTPGRPPSPSPGANGLVSAGTALEFAKLGTLIDPDEVIGLGIYGRERTKPKWRRISYAKTAEIRAQLEAPVPAYGAVQGIIHSLQKEVRRPFFLVRELATDDLVSCFYPTRLYSDVVDALRERTAVLHIAGDTVYDRATRSIVELRVDRIDKTRMLSSEEFEKFFGSMPEFTGELSTDEYIDAIREEDAG